MITAGDAVTLTQRGYGNVSVKEALIVYLSAGVRASQDTYKRLLQIAELSGEWRRKIASRIQSASQ